jgi:hypothetical protein
MSVLDNVANDVAVEYSNLSGDKQAAFDPSTIFTFLEIIVQLMGVLKGCNQSPEDATETLKRPGLFQRIRTRNLVKQHLGTKEFNKVGDQVLEALYKKGRKLSVNDVRSLYEETN